MDRSIARRLLAGGLALGLLAELVLDGPAYGLNIVILVAATLGGRMAAAPTRARPGPARCVAPGRRRWSSRRSWRSAATRSSRSSTRVGALAFAGASLVAFSGLGGHAPVGVGDRGDGRLDARGQPWPVRPARRPAARPAGRRSPVAASRRATRAASDAASCSGIPLAAHLRGPVRVRRPDLPARARRPPRLPDRPRRRSPGGCCSRSPCAWLAAGVLSVSALGIPARRARPRSARRPGRGDRRADRRPRCRRGARHPRRHRPRRRRCSSVSRSPTCSVGSTRSSRPA